MVKQGQIDGATVSLRHLTGHLVSLSSLDAPQPINYLETAMRYFKDWGVRVRISPTDIQSDIRISKNKQRDICVEYLDETRTEIFVEFTNVMSRIFKKLNKGIGVEDGQRISERELASILNDGRVLKSYITGLYEKQVLYYISKLEIESLFTDGVVIARNYRRYITISHTYYDINGIYSDINKYLLNEVRKNQDAMYGGGGGFGGGMYRGVNASNLGYNEI